MGAIEESFEAEDVVVTILDHLQTSVTIKKGGAVKP
jgi:hypothetical protein